MPKKHDSESDDSSNESDNSINDGAIDDTESNDASSDDEQGDEQKITQKNNDGIDGDDQNNNDDDDDKNIQNDHIENDTSCIYDIKAKTKKNFHFDYDDDIILNDDEPSVLLHGIIKPEDRITKPFMTKYERVRILGVRCKQLILGAKPLIKKYSHLSPREIANLELKHGVIPFIIIRELPSGLQEHWKVNELKILN